MVQCTAPFKLETSFLVRLASIKNDILWIKISDKVGKVIPKVPRKVMLPHVGISFVRHKPSLNGININISIDPLFAAFQKTCYRGQRR